MRQVLSKEQLLEEFTKDDFVLKTQKQIVKDFLSIGVEFPIEFEKITCDFDEIIQSIKEELAKLQSKTFTSLQQLIYQIDLPEKLFLEAMSSDDPESDLAHSILQREAYKVYLRTKF